MELLNPSINYLHDEIGDHPFPLTAILDGLAYQFKNYIDLEDRTDYVKTFYNQYNTYMNPNLDYDPNDYPRDLMEMVEENYHTFISHIQKLIKDHLTISIMELESESYHRKKIENILRIVYAYFILNARRNFTRVISRDVYGRFNLDNVTPETLSPVVETYSPLILTIKPMDFLTISGKNGEKVKRLYDDGYISGNFLRKYSPRLYLYPDLEVDIINNILWLHRIEKRIDYIERNK